MNIKATALIAGAFLKKHSPEILTIVGASMIIGGTTYACVKTAKHPETFCALKETISQARETNDKKELTKAYARATGKIAITYAVPAALIGGGVGAMIGANCILSNRLAGVSAAYSTLSTAVTAYRGRVQEALGKDKEWALWTNAKEEKKVVQTIDDNEELSEKEVDVMTPDENTPYSRLFGDGHNPYWSKDTRLVLAHLQGCEGSLNAQLHERGFLTLNDVWRFLGFSDLSNEGLVLGWKYDANDPDYASTYIDLGFADCEKNAKKIDTLKHSWNTEVWVELNPPHILYGSTKKERIRTKDQKNKILETRRGLQ